MPMSSARKTTILGEGAANPALVMRDTNKMAVKLFMAYLGAGASKVFVVSVALAEF